MAAWFQAGAQQFLMRTLSSTFLVERFNNRKPISRSSAATRRDTVDTGMSMAAAARENPFSLATSTNTTMPRSVSGFMLPFA